MTDYARSENPPTADACYDVVTGTERKIARRLHAGRTIFTVRPLIWKADVDKVWDRKFHLTKKQVGIGNRCRVYELVVFHFFAAHWCPGEIPSGARGLFADSEEGDGVTRAKAGISLRNKVIIRQYPTLLLSPVGRSRRSASNLPGDDRDIRLIYLTLWQRASCHRLKPALV